MDKIGGYFLDYVIELIKKGKKFIIVLDNIDWEVRVYDMCEEY